MVLLERGEAVAPEVRRRQLGDHRADPEVVRLVGVVHRLEQPRHEADAGLDHAGLQVGVALEHARRDELHERLDRRLHRVADVVDDRPAVAADGARVAARRHVERDRQPGLGVERPERLERRVVVLEVAPLLGAVDRAVAEAQADEAVLGGPRRLGLAPARRRRWRSRPAAGSCRRSSRRRRRTSRRPSGSTPGTWRRRTPGRASPSTAGPCSGRSARCRCRRARWSAMRSSIVEPALVAQHVLGLHAQPGGGGCRSAFSNDCCSCTVAVFSPRLTSCGRLPSVIIHSEPSSRRSMCGMRSRNSASMYSAEVRARLLGVAVRRDHQVLVRRAGVRRALASPRCRASPDATRCVVIR